MFKNQIQKISKLAKAAQGVKSRAGFTIYELLITISIVVLLLGIVIFNHTKFNSDIEITNLAYSVALAVRQSQVYSISVKQFTASQNDQRFTTPYGLHFNNQVPDTVVFFADSNSDGLYTPPVGTPDSDCAPSNPAAGASECLEKISIGRGNIVKGWCGIFLSDAGVPGSNCFFQNGVGDQYFDVMFRRPNPDALFRLYESAYQTNALEDEPCFDNGPVACTGWAICLIAPQGREKRVVVYETGQISVENVEPGGFCSSS